MNYDPLGFTKHTATLLRGLDASELIPECKKRNISTDVLHELSVQELIMLGIDPEKAKELQSTLNIKKRSRIIVTNEDRFQHFLEIIEHGTQQFSLLQAFVKYCRLRLTKERINFFIDPNKCVSASQVLPISVDATLIELEETKQKLSRLEEFILRSKVKSKHNNIHKICACISGLGLVTLVLLKIYVI